MILVTGATGNVGRPLIEMLVARGEKVRALTRGPGPGLRGSGSGTRESGPGIRESGSGIRESGSAPARVALCAMPGVEVVTAPDLRGVTALFVNPRAVGTGAAALLAAARAAGAGRVVGLAAANVDDDPARQPSRFRAGGGGDRNREVEAAVMASGLAFVSLRPAVFAVNTIGLWGGQLRGADVVRGAFGASVATPVDPRDVAAVAAVALTSDVLDGRRPVLTGPEALTQEQQLAAIGAAIGRRLRWQEVPPAAVRTAMVGSGFAPAFADAHLAMLAAGVTAPPRPTAEVDAVLGRPPRTLAAWAGEHAAAFGRVA